MRFSAELRPWTVYVGDKDISIFITDSADTEETPAQIAIYLL